MDILPGYCETTPNLHSLTLKGGNFLCPPSTTMAKISSSHVKTTSKLFVPHSSARLKKKFPLTLSFVGVRLQLPPPPPPAVCSPPPPLLVTSPQSAKVCNMC